MTKIADFSTPALDIVSQDGGVIVKLHGQWLAKTARNAESICRDLLTKSLSSKILFDLADLKEFDTSGVWLLQRTMEALEKKGHQIHLKNESSTFKTLSERLETCQPSLENQQKSASFFGERLARMGKTSLEVARLSCELIIFLGQVTVGMASVIIRPWRFRFISMVVHMERFGVNAIPIVSLISMALGIVLAYQGEEQLRRFGAEIYTINLVSISIVREVGILIAAILVAGRTGSSITAQIGIMKINQEVDALHTLGLDPMEILIIPRIIALILVMPCLAFVADVAGLIGGGIMVVFSLDVSPQLYIHRLIEAITIGGFWIGIIKAPIFGAIIGVVSCFQGTRVQGTAESVGICTTRSVVEGIFLVTLADALLSVFFSKIGI